MISLAELTFSASLYIVVMTSSEGKIDIWSDSFIYTVLSSIITESIILMARSTSSIKPGIGMTNASTIPTTMIGTVASFILKSCLPPLFCIFCIFCIYENPPGFIPSGTVIFLYARV